MSDTTETDMVVAADTGDSGFIRNLVQLARRLERERDEAMGELARVKKELISANRGAETNAKVNQGLCARLAEAERERDEARRELAEARNIAKMAYTRSIGLGVSSHTPIQFMRDAIKAWDKEQKEEA